MQRVWLGDTPVAVLKPDRVGVQIYAVHTDHLNTPRMLVDANGQVRWRWLGEPFGASPAEEQPTAGLAPVQQQLRFPGQQYEAFGGRHYNHFRDYDPTVGRYVQSDPIGLDGGINTYAYVEGNPLSYVDETGEFANVVLGGGTSVALGWLTAKITGQCYSWEDALIDASTGAIGVNKFRTLYRVAKLRQIASKQGMVAKAPQKGVEKYAGQGTSIEIKWVGNMFGPSGALNDPGSWFPRARYLVAPGSPKGIPKTYLDPFSGAKGPLRSAAAHIQLQATLLEAGILGGANGVVEEAVNGTCGCNK